MFTFKDNVKIITIGSVRSSWFMLENFTTSVPYVKKAPPRKVSKKNIFPTWK